MRRVGSEVSSKIVIRRRCRVRNRAEQCACRCAEDIDLTGSITSAVISRADDDAVSRNSEAGSEEIVQRRRRILNRREQCSRAGAEKMHDARVFSPGIITGSCDRQHRGRDHDLKSEGVKAAGRRIVDCCHQRRAAIHRVVVVKVRTT